MQHVFAEASLSAHQLSCSCKSRRRQTLKCTSLTSYPLTLHRFIQRDTTKSYRVKTGPIRPPKGTPRAALPGIHSYTPTRFAFESLSLLAVGKCALAGISLTSCPTTPFQLATHDRPVTNACGVRFGSYQRIQAGRAIAAVHSIGKLSARMGISSPTLEVTPEA